MGARNALTTPNSKKYYDIREIHTMKINAKKQFITVGVVLLLLIIAALFSSYLAELQYRANIPKEKASSEFIYQETFYKCSQEIPGRWVEMGRPGGRGYTFIPENKSDVDKFCRAGAVIEYRAVIDILKRDDVRTVIEKYDTTQAWVRALGHKYIKDKDYLQRILPLYKNLQIDCIIVVHSPEGTRFFIENGEVHESHDDHKYIEIPAEEFLSSLNNAPDEDVNAFWLALH